MARIIDSTVPPELDGEKLIVFLRGHLKISARLLPKLKNDPKGLRCNGEHIRTVDRIRSGDIITITFPDEECMISPSDTKGLDIIYEDEDILIINKSADIAMHPTHNHQGDTLANKIAAYFAETDKSAVFRAVGRLDKCTSGLVIIALNAHSANILSENVDKEYLALVGGCYKGKGTINKPIIRPDPMKTLRSVGEGGEYAVTHWESVIASSDKSLLRIRLETGRTHQIRVHFSSEGTPLVGDEMYGSRDLSVPRSALHCAKLSFLHPVSKEEMTFEAPLPEDMMRVLEGMKNELL